MRADRTFAPAGCGPRIRPTIRRTRPMPCRRSHSLRTKPRRRPPCRWSALRCRGGAVLFREPHYLGEVAPEERLPARHDELGDPLPCELPDGTEDALRWGVFEGVPAVVERVAARALEVAPLRGVEAPSSAKPPSIRHQSRDGSASAAADSGTPPSAIALQTRAPSSVSPITAPFERFPTIGMDANSNRRDWLDSSTVPPDDGFIS